MSWKMPSLRNIALAFLAGFFGIQVVSLIISSVFPSIPILKGGPAILIILLGITVLSLFILGIKFDELKSKENLIFVALLFGLLLVVYYYLPQKFPQLFSISPATASTIKQTVGQIFSGGMS